MARDVLEVPAPVLLDEADYHRAVLQNFTALREVLTSMRIDPDALKEQLQASREALMASEAKRFIRAGDLEFAQVVAGEHAAASRAWFLRVGRLLHLSDLRPDPTLTQLTRSLRQKLPAERRRFAGNLAGLRNVLPAMQAQRAALAVIPDLAAQIDAGQALLDTLEAHALKLDAMVAEAHATSRAAHADLLQLREKLRWIRHLWRLAAERAPMPAVHTRYAETYIGQVRYQRAQRRRAAEADVEAEAVNADAAGEATDQAAAADPGAPTLTSP
jgi:hypothetical protein